MAQQPLSQLTGTSMSRRSLMKAGAALAGAAALAPGIALADAPPNQGTPPSVVSTPPRDFGPGASPITYPDPDVIQIDPSFGNFAGFGSIKRVWTGGQWLEGPAWSNQGQYLVFSDVLTSILYRYIWDDGRVTKFKEVSYNANGNTIDFQGRLVTCQGLFRRIIRQEHDGHITVVDNYQGKHLNSPNGAVPHPDGSIWFTDPPYGDQLTEGHVDVIGGPANPGNIDPLLGNPIGVPLGGTARELPNATYRWDPSGTLTVVATQEMVPDPNGLDFSPDYKTYYAIATGTSKKVFGPTETGGKGIIYAFDVTGSGTNTKLTNQRVFFDMMVDGIHIGPDDMRVDVDGNIWASANGPLGYSGVLVISPAGKLLGRVRLPEVCANLSFGGPKRNILFMCASQSLYMLTTATQGVHPG